MKYNTCPEGRQGNNRIQKVRQFGQISLVDDNCLLPQYNVKDDEQREHNGRKDENGSQVFDDIGVFLLKLLFCSEAGCFIAIGGCSYRMCFTCSL